MNPKGLMNNAINSMWPSRAQRDAACNAMGQLQMYPGAIMETTPSAGGSILAQLGASAAEKPKNQPLFSARVSVVKAANGYLLTIGTDANCDSTTYIAKDLPEVMDLLQAAMAAVRLEDN